jgi:hypothetical protein
MYMQRFARQGHYKSKLAHVHAKIFPSGTLQFAYSPVRQVVCAKVKSLSSQNLWMELEYQLDVYTVTNSAHIENI